MSLGPAVIDGCIRFLSPSAMEKFDPSVEGGCERKWWLRYIKHSKEPEKDSTKLGTKVHAQIEHYLKTGKDALGEIARSAMRFMPRPGADLLVEHHFGEHTDETGLPIPEEDETKIGRVTSPLNVAGIPIIGKIDVLHRRGCWIDNDGVETPDRTLSAAEALDWKTSKQIETEFDDNGTLVKKGWAKSGEELSRTWQMLSYAKVATIRWMDLEGVRLSHGYMQTKGPRAAQKRSAFLTVDEINARWDAPAQKLVERIKSVARLKVVQEVTPNLDSCKAFGGCPYRGPMCPRDPKQVLAAAFGLGKRKGEGVGLLDRFKKQPEGESKPTEKSGQATEKVGRPSKQEVDAEVEKLKTEETAIRTRGSIAPPDQPAPAEPSKKPEDILPTDGACPSSNNMRKLDEDAIATNRYSCVCGAELKVSKKKLEDGYYAMVPKHAPGVSTEKRGKKKAEEIVPVTTIGTIAEAPKSEPPTTMPLAEMKEIVAEVRSKCADYATTDGLTIYVDAVERGVQTKRLEYYAEELCDALCAEFGAADVRCGKPEGPLGFGRWKGALAALARSQPPAPGAYSVSRMSEIGMVIVEALSTRARVIEGVK